MTSIEDLYSHFSVLAEAKDKAAEHENEYKLIVSATRSNDGNEKRLASQFTTKFFKFFPHLADENLQALFQLCKDPDVAIRKQVIKDLGTICRDCPQFTERVSHLVTNLMHTNDNTELSIVHMSLVSLLKADPKGAMVGIFNNIVNDEGSIRDRALGFLASKTKLLLAEEILVKDVEEAFIQHCRKVLEDVTGDEFKLVMRILAMLPNMGTVQGRQNLLDIITLEADFKSKFDPHSDECLDHLISCIIEAVPLFSKNVHSAKFVEYLCLAVLPAFQEISYSAAEGKELSKKYQVDILKYLAEMVVFCGDLGKVEECVKNVYSCLIEFMPSPDGTDVQNDKPPNVEYLIVECLMYTFHQVARKCPQWLTEANNAERLKDFRLRLQHLAGTLKVSLKYVKDRLDGKSGEISDSERKQFLLTVESTNNLNALIKDLFYNPPAYKTVVVLSFKKQIQDKTGSKHGSGPAAGAKRPSFTPIKFDSGEPQKKIGRTEQKIYSPPGGKFSEKAGVFPAQQGTNQRGGRRGGGFRRW